MLEQDRATALGKIAAEISTCTLCRLHESRTRTVPGAGNPNAEILFIGEGPGFYEDKQGLPFVGKSGDYLNRMLALISLDRATVFITNVVKCRPPENRDPLPDEIGTCKPYLDNQIALIDPLVIVTLGRFSMARYFPNGKITQIHGKPKYENGRAYYPLFHPAAVLRNPTMEPQMEADFRRLPEVIAEVKRQRAANPPAGGGTPGGNPPPPPDEPPTKPKQLSLF
jgi:DNA polymerase